MDAFESLIATLLRRDGWWTISGFKVELTKPEKRRIQLPSTPRWELDLVAYKGAINEFWVVECKSFLDSPGVKFRRGRFEPERRYKLFVNETLRKVVLKRLVRQLVGYKAIARSPKVRLCLAAGKLAGITRRDELKRHFDARGWLLFDPDWILQQLHLAADDGYCNDVGYMVAKLLRRHAERGLLVNGQDEISG